MRTLIYYALISLIMHANSTSTASESPPGLIYPVALLGKNDDGVQLFFVCYQSNPGDKYFLARYSQSGVEALPHIVPIKTTPNLNDTLGLIFGTSRFLYKGCIYHGMVHKFKDGLLAIQGRQTANDNNEWNHRLHMFWTHSYDVIDDINLIYDLNGKQMAETRYLTRLDDSTTKEIFIKNGSGIQTNERISSIILANSLLVLSTFHDPHNPRRGALIQIIDCDKLLQANMHVAPESSKNLNILSCSGQTGITINSRLLKYNDDVALIVWAENLVLPWIGPKNNEKEGYRVYISTINVKTKDVSTKIIFNVDGVSIDYVSAEIIEDTLMICYNESTDPSDVLIKFYQIINDNDNGNLSFKKIAERKIATPMGGSPHNADDNDNQSRSITSRGRSKICTTSTTGCGE